MMTEQQSPDMEEWKCITAAKACAGHDPCYFPDERERCPGHGFRIRTKKVGLL